MTSSLLPPDAAGALLLQGVLLGLGAAVPIGPVNVQLARRALRDGFGAGVALGCGAVSVDVMYAVVSGFSFTAVLTQPAVGRAVTVVGVVLLLYLAFLSFRAAWRDWRVDPIAAGDAAGPSAPQSAAAAWLTGFLMTLLNPLTLAFWFTVVPGQIAKGRTGGLPMICAGVFIGTLAWVVAFAGLLAWAGRWRRNWWTALADAAGGAALLGFAAAGVLRLVRPFL